MCSTPAWRPASGSSAVISRNGGRCVSDSLLVVDVGTSGLRAAIVRPDATVEHVHHRPLLPDTPAAGLVEFDAATMATAALECAQAAVAAGGPPAAGRLPNPRGAPSRGGPATRRARPP